MDVEGDVEASSRSGASDTPYDEGGAIVLGYWTMIKNLLKKH